MRCWINCRVVTWGGDSLADMELAMKVFTLVPAIMLLLIGTAEAQQSCTLKGEVIGFYREADAAFPTDIEGKLQSGQAFLLYGGQRVTPYSASKMFPSVTSISVQGAAIKPSPRGPIKQVPPSSEVPLALWVLKSDLTCP
jgi:hypothetical protein